MEIVVSNKLTLQFYTCWNNQITFYLNIDKVDMNSGSLD